MTRRRLTAALLLSLTACAWAEKPYEVAWTRQIGTEAYETCSDVAVDGSGNIYIAGITEGDLAGTNIGGADAYVSKFDPEGNELWTKQFGTTLGDWGRSIAVDGDGNAYVCGNTEGDFDDPMAGDTTASPETRDIEIRDAFLCKFGPDGRELWRRQYGTDRYDAAESVTVGPSGNIYVAGTTQGDLEGLSAGGDDAYVCKFDPDGEILWTQQVGTAATDTGSFALEADSGWVYLFGGTYSERGAPRARKGGAFVSKISSGGKVLRTLFGGRRGDDAQEAAMAASGDIYVVGTRWGDFDAPTDGFVSRLNPSGKEIWTKTVGSPRFDLGFSIVMDTSDYIYLVGETKYSIGGDRYGKGDIFLGRYDPDGNVVWMTPIGTSERDGNPSVAIDASGDLYICGSTDGDLGAPNAGKTDAFLIKLSTPDEDGAMTGEQTDE